MSPELGQLVREGSRFFVVTCIGLTVDYGLYLLLTTLGVSAGVANAVSASTAVIVLYFLNTRYAFPSEHHMRSIVLFFGWYAVSVVGFSLLVEWWAQSMPAWQAKIASLPFSFLANFIAVRLILHRAAADHAARLAADAGRPQA